MEAHEVRLAQEVREAHVLDPQPGEAVAGEQVVGQHAAAEAAQEGLGDDAADLAGADDARGLAVQVEPQQALEREVALAHVRVCTREVTVERQGQGDGEFGNGVRRVVGHVGHGEPEVARGAQVDVVEAGRPERHQAGAVCGEVGQHRPAQVVVDERADGRRAVGKRRRRQLQPRVVEDELVAEAGLAVDPLEEIAVVGLAAEHGDSHTG